MSFLERMSSSVRNGMAHVTDAFSNFLHGPHNEASTHTPVATNITHHDANNLNGASTAASGPTGTVPRVLITPSNYDGSQALQRPASVYMFPFARSAMASSQSLPPPYSPREEPPTYSRSLGGGRDDRFGLGFAATLRRISDRLSATTLLDNTPFGRPTQIWVRIITPPRLSTRTPPTSHLPYPNAAYRPRRLGWLNGKWKVVTALAIGGLVVGLVSVFIVMEQKWEKSRT